MSGWRKQKLTKEISSSGWTNLDVKPDEDSGFLIVGAPVMVAVPPPPALGATTAAAAGNVGLGGPNCGGVEDADD